MKTRILFGALYGIIFLVILFALPAVCLVVVTAGLCGLAVYEVLNVTGNRKYLPLMIISVLFAVCAPFFWYWGRLASLLVILLYAAAVVAVVVNRHMTMPVQAAGFAFFITLLISLSISCMAYLRLADGNGVFYVLMCLIIPWMCDIGAYFTGTFIGKTKLCPKISPKKTVEGLFGGVTVSLGISLLAVLIYQVFFQSDAAPGIYLWKMALAALIGAPVSVLGDLFASVIKRQHGVKDFGKFLPGHGGVMDRFDSLVLTAPILLLIVLM